MAWYDLGEPASVYVCVCVCMCVCVCVCVCVCIPAAPALQGKNLVWISPRELCDKNTKTRILAFNVYTQMYSGTHIKAFYIGGVV